MDQIVRIGSAMPTFHYRTKPIACSGGSSRRQSARDHFVFQNTVSFRLRTAHSGSRLPSAPMNGFPFTLQCNRELANSAPDLLPVQGSESQLQLLWPNSALVVAVYGSYIYIALGCGSGRGFSVEPATEPSGTSKRIESRSAYTSRIRRRCRPKWPSLMKSQSTSCSSTGACRQVNDRVASKASNKPERTTTCRNRPARVAVLAVIIVFKNHCPPTSGPTSEVADGGP
jgi:hypothetical protein